MISYEEIKRSAHLVFNDYLRYTIEHLTGQGTDAQKEGSALPYFPLTLQFASNTFSDSIKEKVSVISEIYENSKNESGAGYSLDIETISTRSNGRKGVIKRIYFASEEDYLSFVQKENEVSNLKDSLNSLIKEDALKLDLLNEWAKEHTAFLMEEHRDKEFWHNICIAATWLLQNPESNLYLKEIPIDVPASFLEEHKNLIHSFISSDPIKISFEVDHGLKKKPFSIRFRSLSKQNPIMLGSLKPEEIALSLGDFAKLEKTGFLENIEIVLIVENEMPYLTFPNAESTLAILGQPHTLNALKLCKWLKNYKIIYFGSLKEHSFDNLSAFRSNFPNTYSMCMDTKTLEHYSFLLERGSMLKNKSIPKRLTEDENVVFLTLRLDSEKNVIEQDKLELDYIIEEFKEVSKL